MPGAIHISNEDRAARDFLKDVASHALEVKLDNGIYRHLSFRRVSSFNQWFDIVTWPGFLCICGDMGTWTFARLADMFNFFRDSQLRINASYWAEKLQNGTIGGRSNAKEWDEDVFTADVLQQLTDYYGLEGERLTSVTEDLKQTLSYESGNGRHALYRAVADFKYRDGARKFYFDSCELPDGMVYSYHFLWCLYAIVWGIQQYDESAIRLRREKEEEEKSGKL